MAELFRIRLTLPRIGDSSQPGRKTRRFRDLVQREWARDADAERLPAELLDGLLRAEAAVVGRKVVVQRNLERGQLFLKARERQPVDSLSSREFMVARLLSGGLSQKQVAAKLERSPETIRSQSRVIFDKCASTT